MRPHKLTLAFLLSAFLLTGISRLSCVAAENAATGDPRMWKKHFSAGTDALRKNDYAIATAAFNLALADSENFTGREAYKKVETLSELGHPLGEGRIGLDLQGNEKVSRSGATLPRIVENGSVAAI